MRRRFEHAGRYWTIEKINPQACEIRFGEIDGVERTITRTIDGDVAIDAMVAKQCSLGYVEVTPVKAVTAAIDRGTRWTRRFVDDTTGTTIELSVDDKLVVQRYGDKPPAVSIKQSHAEAVETVEKMIRTYIGNGFVLFETTAEPLAHELAYAPNAELEAACRATPADDATWGVYRDWLVAHGDPRGEYAALIAAGKPDDAKALIEPIRESLLGIHDEVAIAGARHGFPSALVIARDDPDGGIDFGEIVRDTLAKPIYAFVDAIQFGLAAFSDANDWRDTAEAVCASPIGVYVRELRFDRYEATDAELSWVPFGDFSTVWPRLPRLETLVIKAGAGGTLGAIELPELRRFELISTGLSHDEAVAIATARWPKLEHLSIWTGGGYRASATLLDLLPVFAGERLPALRHLGIVNSELVDGVVEALVGSPLLPRLTSLDISKGTLVSAAVLVENAAAFRHLSVIDVGENQLAPDELARIHNALPQARSAGQRERYDAQDPDDDGRFVAISE
jgi:uncharacterized protein (TIGR02996 family)